MSSAAPLRTILSNSTDYDVAISTLIPECRQRGLTPEQGPSDPSDLTGPTVVA
jgi:hypothetical protein